MNKKQAQPPSPSGLLGAAAALAAMALFSLAPATATADSRPNIVLILSDNQGHSLIGAYGNDEIKTPNIDRLAARGMQFNHAFAVNGVCSPTRATLLTGLIPSQTGIHVALPSDLDVPDWSGVEEFRSLPQTLSEAGYNTGLVGKYHLGMPQRPQLGFQYWVTFPSGHTTTFYDQQVIDNGNEYQVSGHLTDFWTEKATHFLSQQKKGKPFFLYLAYNGPYNLPPTVTMEPRSRHAAYYRQRTPSMPQEKIHPYLKKWAQGKGIRTPTQLMLKEGTTAWTAIEALNNKVAMINIAAETTMVDDGVGKVTQALEELGLAENTLVIYTSDQGASYGHHGLFGNTSWSFPFTVHNVNMQVPLIFNHPGHIPPGLRSDRVINQFDIFPTLLDYLGMGAVEIANSPGKSFAPLLRGGDVEDWDDAAYFEFVTVRAVRTPQWKYMKRLDREEPDTLHQLEQDPGETNNLAQDPAYGEVVKQLDEKLTRFFDAYGDEKYDLWRGGTAKGILLEKYYGRDDIFRDRFPGWETPSLKKAERVFTDLKR